MFDKSKLKIKDYKVKLKSGIYLALIGILISSPQNCLVGFGNFVLAVNYFAVVDGKIRYFIFL